MISVQTENNDNWKRNLAGEIVTKDNLNSYIPELKLGEENTNTILNEILAIDKAKGSWQEYFSVLEKKGHGAIVDLIKNTNDLSKLTGDDLVKANQQARATALAHNEALKQQTLGAKAATVAMKALAIAGNMLLMWGITKIIESVTKAWDNHIHSLENAREKYKETTSELESVESELETINSQIDEILAKDTLTLTDEEDLKRLQLENAELENRYKLLQAQKELDAQNLNKEIEEKYNNLFKSNNNLFRVDGIGDGSIDFEEYFHYLVSRYDELLAKGKNLTESENAEAEQIRQTMIEEGNFLAELTDGYTAVTNDQKAIKAGWEAMIEAATRVSTTYVGATTDISERLKDKFANGADMSDGSTHMKTSDTDKQISSWIDTLTEDEQKILLSCELDNASLNELKTYVAEQIAIIEKDNTYTLSTWLSSTSSSGDTFQNQIDNWKSNISELHELLESTNSTDSDISTANAIAQFPDLYPYVEQCNDLSTAIQTLMKDSYDKLIEGFGDTANIEGFSYQTEHLNGILTDALTISDTVSDSLDRTIDKYQELLNIVADNFSIINSQISLLESNGETIGRAIYDELLNQTQQKHALLTEQYNSLKHDFANAMANGIKKGSNEWLDLNNSILEVYNSIINTEAEMTDIQNTIDQLHWNSFDKIKEAIENISNEAGSLINLLENDTLLDTNGKFTSKSLTQLALYAEQLEAAKYLINQYSAEIDYLNNEYAKNTITTEEYHQKLQELNDGQWDSVDAYNSAKDAIIDLRKNAIEEEINALEELHDIRKKALNQEKEQLNWEKSVAENENNISKLKTELAELSNDNSLEATKKRQELEAELEEAQTEWSEELYNHTLEEREKALDDELEQHKELLEETLNDENALLTDSLDMVNQNSSTILSTLNQLSQEYGINISTALTEPFTHGAQALSGYSSMFTQSSSTFTTQLSNTAASIYDLQTKADTTAASIVNMFNSANGTLAEQIDTARTSIEELLRTLEQADSGIDVGANIGAAKQSLNNPSDLKSIINTNLKTTLPIKSGYATGTKSATPGYHPTFEKGIEIIAKDGQLLIPYSGGEMVFNNEQLARLWDISSTPADYILPNINLPDFSNILSNIPVARPEIKIEQRNDFQINVDGGMTPDVLQQISNNKNIAKKIKDLAMEGTVEAISSRGFRFR